MSAFIANQPNPPAQSVVGQTALPVLDDFYPAIDLAVLRTAIRIDGTVIAERLHAAASAAQLQLAAELAPLKQAGIWQHLWQLDPYNRATPITTKPTHSAAEALYLRAAHSLVAAEVADRYRGYDATAQGHQRADQIEPTADTLRRDARWAIRDLLGTPRTTVELV